MGAFHAYDIRGIYGKDFTLDTVYKVGYFIPRLLKCTKVLVGRDARVSSNDMRDALIRGINDAGVDVVDIGLATTPMVYFATAKYNFKASVQITASHNPKEYNGLKISMENALPVGYDTGLKEIEGWILNNEPIVVAKERGGVEFMDIMQDYMAFQLRYKGDYSNLNVSVDISNGMAALVIKDLLKDSCKELHYIFDDIDGTFPNHEANPLIPENTLALRELVKEKGSDIGVIYDGDADRVMFVDENSRFISPDLIIALMGDYWLNERGLKGRVIQDIRSSKAVGEFLEPMGGEMYTWKVGRAFAARKLREIDGVYGGELAGHYYFKEFFYSDSGVMASLIVLDIVSKLKREGITLSAAIAKIERYKNSGEINFKLERKREAMDAVRDYFTSVESAVKSMDFDGYRVEFNDWWFNIRPSNTEPYLRFLAEATSTELLEEKILKVKEIIAEYSK